MALDCYLQLEFLLEKDKEKRALHFLYHYNKNRLHYLERIMHSDSPNSLANKLANDDTMNEFSLTDEEKEMALVDFNSLQEILNSDENSEIAKEYGTKRKQTWYHALIKSHKIEDLAKVLKRSAMYEIIFRNLSSFIHGEDIVHSNVVFFQDGLVGLKNLRDATQLNFIVINTTIILRRAILLFIKTHLNSDADMISKLKTLNNKKKDV